MTETLPRTLAPSDFLRADALKLDDDGRTVRELVRDYVRRELLPHVKDWDAGRFAPHADQQSLVRALARGMGGLGIFGAALPELGTYLDDPDWTPLSYTNYGVAMRELEAADSGVRSIASVQSSLAMYAIHEYGSEEQKRRWLGPLHRGEKLGCFALTEPQGGSDPGTMQTRAVPDKGGWVLDGAKAWITNGFADVAVVWARTPEGIRGFLVEHGTPGFSDRTEEKWALRAGIASSLSFASCRIPEDALLPKTARPAGKDLGAALRCLTSARYGICWGAVGAARACLEEALEASQRRLLFGRPLAARQETQRKLVTMLVKAEAASLVAFQLGALLDRGELDHLQVSLGKVHNVALALETAQAAVELLPADVFTFDAFHAGRHLRNLEVVKKYEGAHEVHWLILGRALTGHDAL